MMMKAYKYLVRERENVLLCNKWHSRTVLEVEN